MPFASGLRGLATVVTVAAGLAVACGGDEPEAVVRHTRLLTPTP